MSVIRFIRWVVRWTVRSAVVVGIGTLVARLLQRGQDGTTDADRSTSASAPSPTFGRATTALPGSGQAPAAAGAEDGTPTWTAPVEGACPTSHPVKLKETSGIFHLPGDLAYERTVPDRCYRDAAAAEADGYRQAKR